MIAIRATDDSSRDAQAAGRDTLRGTGHGARGTGHGVMLIAQIRFLREHRPNERPCQA